MFIALKYVINLMYNFEHAPLNYNIYLTLYTMTLKKTERILCMNDFMNIYKKWLSCELEDTDLKDELIAIENDSNKIEEAFYKELEFGTGGLRGVIGAGTNRINIYTVRKATQGLSDYLNQTFNSPSVAIAYDSRIKSDLFARESARVFAANGIQVYLYPELMPTPALSFAVRELKCSGGIVITASHNPAKYNGYKVYGSDGCQITLDAANTIISLIEPVDCFEDVKIISFDDAVSSGKISFIPDLVTDNFLKSVSRESVRKVEGKNNLKIVYTPLNGAGLKCVTSVLESNGFENLIMVSSQEMPDGNFTTCPFPNPEIREALSEGLAVCESNNADLLLATDPDCDRVGTAVRDSDGNYVLINGNEMGVLLLNYICEARSENGTMPENPVAIKTIVTTEMAKDIADSYGVEIIDVLTGFKFIGEQIGILESKGQENRYIFGFEESYGYLSGSYVRDKDGVNASLLICEMTAYYKSKGISVLDALDSLYKKYGYYLNSLQSFDFEGISGLKIMNSFIEELRNNPPENILGNTISYISDYMKSVTCDSGGNTHKINLPSSDVIKFGLSDGSSIVVRPSGTEPKLKLYYSVKSESKELSSDKIRDFENYFGKIIKDYK